MPGSTATVTVSNFDIGPCQVVWNSVDMGGTHDNVKIKFKYDKSFLTADQTGKTKLDAAVTGIECTIATSFLETRNKMNFASLFPNSILNGTTHKYINFMEQTGVRQLSLAGPLLLHPLVDASSSLDNEWYFYKALPMDDSEYDFGPSTQAKLKINWTVLLDLSAGAPGRMFRAGDHTL